MPKHKNTHDTQKDKHTQTCHEVDQCMMIILSDHEDASKHRNTQKDKHTHTTNVYRVIIKMRSNTEIQLMVKALQFKESCDLG